MDRKKQQEQSIEKLISRKQWFLKVLRSRLIELEGLVDCVENILSIIEETDMKINQSRIDSTDEGIKKNADDVNCK